MCLAETSLPAGEISGNSAFAERMLTTLNHGALCLMASVGHRVGLFDAMKSAPSLTSGELASRSGLNERYVREWLGAMTASGVVRIEPGADADSRDPHYRLPTEHAAFLTRGAGADNLAMFTQFIAVLGGVEDDIVECFKNGGGVPYDRFPRFHDVMAEDSDHTVVDVLESRILPLVPGLTDRLRSGIRVLDLGCGRGRALNRLAELFPASRFQGIDLSAKAIACARDEASARGLKNIEFRIADLSDYNVKAEPEAFDLIFTFDAIHDQGRPLNVLKGIHRTLKPDGVYLMQEIRGSSAPRNNISHPIGTFLYTISCMHCMTVSLAQGGEGVGAMWGEEKTREYLNQAGFSNVETRQFNQDIQNNRYIATKAV